MVALRSAGERLPGLHEREPCVDARPRDEIARHVDRSTQARQQDAAAAGTGELERDRRSCPDGGVERGLRVRAGARTRVQDDERAGARLGDQPPLEQSGAACERRPVDPRRGRTGHVRTQTVDLAGAERLRRSARRAAPCPPASARRPPHGLGPRQHEQFIGRGRRRPS